MSVIVDGERSRAWVPFAKKKLAALKDLGLMAKCMIVDGYTIRLLAIDDIEKISITAPPYSSVAVGGSYSASSLYIVDAVGRLWVGGENSSGQLGLGDLIDRPYTTSLVATPTNLPRWARVFAGESAIFAVAADGTLWFSGTLTGIDSYHSVIIHHTEFTQLGSDTGWRMASSNTSTAVAVKCDGTMWLIGAKHVLSGTVETTATLTQIGLGIKWSSAIIGGTGYSEYIYAIDRDGYLYGIGDNGGGQMGLPYTITQIAQPIYDCTPTDMVYPPLLCQADDEYTETGTARVYEFTKLNDRKWGSICTVESFDAAYYLNHAGGIGIDIDGGMWTFGGRVYDDSNWVLQSRAPNNPYPVSPPYVATGYITRSTNPPVANSAAGWREVLPAVNAVSVTAIDEAGSVHDVYPVLSPQMQTHTQIQITPITDNAKFAHIHQYRHLVAAVGRDRNIWSWVVRNLQNYLEPVISIVPTVLLPTSLEMPVAPVAPPKYPPWV